MSITDIDVRMKEQYEDRFRIMLPRRSYTIIRVDGRAFHTWTRGLPRPYSQALMQSMDHVAKTLCESMPGAQMAYVQSDEVSVLLTDFARIDTHAWFDNNLQKLCSISASIATAAFNVYAITLLKITGEDSDADKSRRLAHFDSRVFQIPDPVEVANYFVARQKDASRNSVSMLAQHYCSANELHGVSCEKMHDKIHEHGDNWNDHPIRFKHGGAVVKEMCAPYQKETKVGLVDIPEHLEWAVVDPPIFTKERAWLESQIPRHETW